MIITELVDGGSTECRGVSDGCMEMVKVDCELEGSFVVPDGGGEIVKGRAKAKRVLVGAGARILFYPTLMYNVIRNKLQTEFRWWDEVDQFILLGAVPFPADVPRLRKLGVRGVITLNEPYETLVPSSLYQLHGIDHLVIPTRDYLFAPSLVDICQAVDFIHRNASHGRTTYVHCKAGRGRSTTIVLCYLVEYKHMTPTAALEYVRSIRPRVLLAPSQWRAVQEYSRRKLEFPAIQSPRPTYLLTGDEVLISVADLEGYSPDGASKEVNTCLCEIAENKPVIVKHMPTVFDEDEVLVTEADLEGYNSFVNAKEKADSENVTKPLTRKLSCLFASLKFSSGGQSSSSRLHEIRAC